MLTSVHRDGHGPGLGPAEQYVTACRLCDRVRQRCLGRRGRYFSLTYALPRRHARQPIQILPVDKKNGIRHFHVRRLRADAGWHRGVLNRCEWPAVREAATA
jgi:hypothetical protein